MDAEEIKILQADRLRYLENAYHRSKGDPQAYIPWEETGKELGFNQERIQAIMYWLQNENLIKFETTTSFCMTNYGIRIIEDAITNPEQPTGPFIAYNSIHIDQMINSNIQQGTVNSIQQVIIQQKDLEMINTFVNKFEGILEKLNLDSIQRQDVTVNIDTIRAQTKSSKPKKQTVVDALNSIREILQALPTAQILATELISNIRHLLNALGVN